jgi:hypothetical protein
MEGNDLRSAQDQGFLISAVAGRSRFATDVRSLAEALALGDRR